MNQQDQRAEAQIELPPEFQSGNEIPVERATITRSRMIEILNAAIAHDRQQREQEYPHEQMDAIGTARFKVVPCPKNVGLIFSTHAVRAGDGEQILWHGSKSSCEHVARRMTGAFFDGGWVLFGLLGFAGQKQRGEPVAWRWSESNGERWFGWTTDWSHHDRAVEIGCLVEYAAPSAPQPAESVKLECPKCGADRAKEPCAGNLMNCAFKGEAHAAEPVKVPSDELEGLADRAYCQYIEQMRRPECLAWEQKVKDRRFGEAELNAHTKAGEFLGRHRAFSEARALLSRYGSAQLAAPVAAQPSVPAYPADEWVQAFFGDPDEMGVYRFDGDFGNIAFFYGRAMQTLVAPPAATPNPPQIPDSSPTQEEEEQWRQMEARQRDVDRIFDAAKK